MNEENVLERMIRGLRRATTATVLTHNIDFVFAQSLLVSRLRRCGAPRLTVFADAGCASATFGRQSDFATMVGRTFRVIPVDMGLGRRFHPKAIFLAGPEGARLAIGSGNLGHGGWSANREIWTYFDLPGDGGAAIASFRDYLERICELADVTEAVVATVMEPFRSEQWAHELPEAAGLLGLPGASPLLDRMLELVGPGVTSFDVLVPYFDENGEAASDVARRVGVPLRLLIQQGKAGLSAPAAAALPANARVLGVSPAAKAIQTIHAKLYAAHEPNGITLFAGSANCSNAALRLATGNAELMAVSRLTPDAYRTLLSGLEISEKPPPLPDAAPNVDWDEIESPPVRIASASFEAGHLKLRCVFAGGIVPAEFCVLCENNEPLVVPGAGETYEIEIVEPGSRIWIQIESAERTFRSPPMWIDHEAELRVGRPELNVHNRLSATQGPVSSDGLIEIFSLFIEHLKNPIPWAGGFCQGKPRVAIPYDINDVFSEGFGHRSYAPVPGPRQTELDEWSLLFNLFRIGGRRSQRDMPPPEPEDDDDPLTELSGDNLVPEPVKPLTESQEQKLRRLVDVAVTAMSNLTFLESRPPARLAADIGTAALLLVIARGRLPRDAKNINAASAKLFAELFLGVPGRHGLLALYLDRFPKAVESMASPGLTAAITLWIADLWSKTDRSQDFPFTVARLAATHPFLALGGKAAEAEIMESLSDLSQYVDALAATLPDFWINWVRASAAIAELDRVLKCRNQVEPNAAPRTIRRGEVVWAKGQFAIALKDFDHRSKAYLALLEEVSERPFQGSKVHSVLDLIDQLGLSEDASRTAKGLLTPADA